MSEGTLLLVLAYVALTALLMTALITTRLPLAVKSVMAVATVGLYIASYQGWQSVQGWPAAAKRLPDRFLLHASVIQEPNKATGEEGAIYIWASDLADGKPADNPRAFRLNYEKPLHIDLEEAMRNMRDGNLQLGRLTKDSHRPDRPTDLTRLGERRDTIEFYDLPDPTLPEK